MSENSTGSLALVSSRLAMPDSRLAEEIQSFVAARFRGAGDASQWEADGFWDGLRRTGPLLWCDSGDLRQVEDVWTREFSGLTTNNTLLNAEVQKGGYDDLIREAASIVSDLDERARVVEIGFILNARHALALVERFGARVSVELHTDLAHDAGATLAHARRYFAIAPEHFVVKVPWTPAGLIASRVLGREGIPVNMTLGFSARQNFLAAAFARPAYVNVFAGRVGAYFEENHLGDGTQVGEKATLASQRELDALNRGRTRPTRQIAASLRRASQLADLAGVDVLTVPVAVLLEAKRDLSGAWSSRRGVDPEVALPSGLDPSSLRAETLWEVSERELDLAERLDGREPEDPRRLVARARDSGVGDLFPRYSAEDLARLEEGGKIPHHATWAKRIAARELAIDTLLNAAGLASFAADQRALDGRIERCLSLA